MKRWIVIVMPLIVLVFTTQSKGAIGLSFLIDGDTWQSPFSITNTSTGTEEVVRFQLDLSTVTTGRAILFDTVGGSLPPNTSSGQDFQPTGGADLLTGLVPLLGSPKVADGATLLDISFTDFQPGESFTWLIDVDPADGITPSTITGNMMIGVEALIDFSTGRRLTGVLEAVPNNGDAAQFSVRYEGPTPGSVPEPSTLAVWGTLCGLGLIAARRRRKRVA